MAIVRLAVGEFHPELRPATPAWERLRRELERGQPDILLLNELPFGRWLSTSDTFDSEMWQASLEAHEAGCAALAELGVPIVLGSRSVELDGRRCNEAFVWSTDAGLVGVHTKQYLPDSPGYRETTWYERGQPNFNVVDVGPLKVGFLICTEVMFNEHARHYGRMGADLIVVPRASPPPAAHIFEVAIQMAAVVSGCYVASSNRTRQDSLGARFGGRGSIVNPVGVTMAQSSMGSPINFHDLNTDLVAMKKTLYPCNVTE